MTSKILYPSIKQGRLQILGKLGTKSKESKQEQSEERKK